MADGAVGVPDTTEVGEAGAAEADAAGTVMSLADGEAASFPIFCTCSMRFCHGIGCFFSFAISSLFRRACTGFSLILLSRLPFFCPRRQSSLHVHPATTFSCIDGIRCVATGKMFY